MGKSGVAWEGKMVSIQAVLTGAFLRINLVMQNARRPWRQSAGNGSASIKNMGQRAAKGTQGSAEAGKVTQIGRAHV